MSTLTTSDSRHDRTFLISHQLRAAKRELQSLLLEISSGTTLDKDKLGALGQDALEVLSLVRSVTNGLAPINKLPNEVLALIPYVFGDPRQREKIIVTLTHVCRAWRKTFISCASLWTNFYCADTHKTQVYLERSKTSPINLWLRREKGRILGDPFLEIAPHVIGRLQRLDVVTTLDYLQTITQHLVQPVPLLKSLAINAGTSTSFELPTELFGGDLSSLNELHIRSVRTQLPWRGMNNLTSFRFSLEDPPTLSVGQFLDFFESAPRLLEVDLTFTTPTFGAQDQRLVTMAHLRELSIYGCQSPALLLNHLIIPAGAGRLIQLGAWDPHVGELLPISLENLENLSNFTKVDLRINWASQLMRFAGPSGQLTIASTSDSDATRLVAQVLARLDTSNTQHLKIGSAPPLNGEIYQAIQSMTNLRTLRMSRYTDVSPLFLNLHHLLAPNNAIACPKLEKIICHVRRDFDIETMLSFAEGRVSRGVPLKSIKLIGFNEPLRTEWVMLLQTYVPHVETHVKFRGYSYWFRDDSGEEDD